MIRRPPRSTRVRSSAASDVYKRQIINTHAHYDHFAAAADLMKEFDVPFYMHENEEAIMADPKKNLSSLLSSGELLLQTCSLISGDVIDNFLNLGIKIMNFAGHTPGSIITVSYTHLRAHET